MNENTVNEPSLLEECVKIVNNLVRKRRFSEDDNLTDREKTAIEILLISAEKKVKEKMKVGDTFWEVNNNHIEPVCYPRIAHTEQHVEYYNKRLGTVTFPNEEAAQRRVDELNKERQVLT